VLGQKLDHSIEFGAAVPLDGGNQQGARVFILDTAGIAIGEGAEAFAQTGKRRHSVCLPPVTGVLAPGGQRRQKRCRGQQDYAATPKKFIEPTIRTPPTQRSVPLYLIEQIMFK